MAVSRCAGSRKQRLRRLLIMNTVLKKILALAFYFAIIKRHY